MTESASTAKIIQIAHGTSASQIGRELESAGLIRSALAWNLWARWLAWQKLEGGFQAGTYEVSPNQSLEEIASQIWSGQVVQQQFTIPEGWTLKQMADAFAAQGFFSADDFLAAARQIPYVDYSWLPAGLPHLEGFLYPDTYVVPQDQITPEFVIQQMLNRFAKQALPLYTQYQRQHPSRRHSQSQLLEPLNLRDWVTLSSIVEKEAVVGKERPRIAGVFLRRLQLNMTLGSDPTVEYGLKITQTPDQPLTLKQVKTPSPYNTYLNPGLPPTPIGSPGLSSLKAVLEPEKTPYLYFVARYDGTHVFSRTLREHEAAQAKIRDQWDNPKRAVVKPRSGQVTPSPLRNTIGRN